MSIGTCTSIILLPIVIFPAEINETCVRIYLTNQPFPKKFRHICKKVLIKISACNGERNQHAMKDLMVPLHPFLLIQVSLDLFVSSLNIRSEHLERMIQIIEKNYQNIKSELENLYPESYKKALFFVIVCMGTIDNLDPYEKAHLLGMALNYTSSRVWTSTTNTNGNTHCSYFGISKDF